MTRVQLEGVKTLNRILYQHPDGWETRSVALVSSYIPSRLQISRCGWRKRKETDDEYLEGRINK